MSQLSKKALPASALIPSPSAASKARSDYGYSNVQPSLSGGFDPKLPFFGMLLLVFCFSLFIYSRIGLDSKNLFVLSEIQLTATKFASPASLLFLLTMSLSLALASFSARGLDPLQAVGYTLAATMLPALVLGLLVFPAYTYPFIAFSMAIVAAAFFSNGILKESTSLSSVYTVVNRALLVFTIVAFVLTFVAVSQQKDKYFDDFFYGIASIAPAAAAQGAGILSQVITSYQVTRESVEQFYPRDKVREQLSSSVPMFSSLNTTLQDTAIDQTYDSILVPQINSLKNGFAKSLREFSAKPPSEMGRAQLDSIKAQLSTSPSFKDAYDYFAISMAFLVVSILSIFKIPVQLIATGLAYLLVKYL